MMTLIPCGTTVIIGEDIRATVVAACIRQDRVTYEVVWWDGRTRKSDWVEEMEVWCADETKKTTIGFRSAAQ